MKQSKMCFAYVPVTSRVRRTVGHVHEFEVSFDTLIKEFDLSENDLLPDPETHIFVVCSLLDYSLTAHISTSVNREGRFYTFSALIGQSDQSVAVRFEGPNRLGLLVIEV